MSAHLSAIAWPKDGWVFDNFVLDIEPNSQGDPVSMERSRMHPNQPHEFSTPASRKQECQF